MFGRVAQINGTKDSMVFLSNLSLGPIRVNRTTESFGELSTVDVYGLPITRR